MCIRDSNVIGNEIRYRPTALSFAVRCEPARDRRADIGGTEGVPLPFDQRSQRRLNITLIDRGQAGKVLFHEAGSLCKVAAQANFICLVQNVSGWRARQYRPKHCQGGLCRWTLAEADDEAFDESLDALRVDRHATEVCTCLLYTSDAADDLTRVDLGGRRIIKKKK